MITLLATDGIPGLRQVCREKHKHPRTWENVNYVKWAFVVNLGDMMERWTNCILRVLPPHRSPFVDTEAEGYVPEHVDTIQRIQAAAIYIPLGSWLLSYHLEYLDIGIPTDSILPTRIHRQPLSVTNPSETTYTDGFPTETAVSKDQFCSSVSSNVLRL
ncbi:2-oxoglutarate (2OG) and Fe(II)-dependent oxygenase superfamily protein [Tanacetum coccineum]